MDLRDLAERFYSDFVDGRFDTIAAHLDPEVEFVNPDDAIEAGTHRGPEPFLGALRRLHEFFDYDMAEIEEWSEQGAQAVAVVRFVGSGKGSGAPMDASFAHVLDFRGDRLVRLSWFSDPKAAG